jgi:hypothetical protein
MAFKKKQILHFVRDDTGAEYFGAIDENEEGFLATCKCGVGSRETTRSDLVRFGSGCSAPKALTITLYAYPALTGWANLWRASGAWSSSYEGGDGAGMMNQPWPVPRVRRSS